MSIFFTQHFSSFLASYFLRSPAPYSFPVFTLVPPLCLLLHPKLSPPSFPLQFHLHRFTQSWLPVLPAALSSQHPCCLKAHHDSKSYFPPTRTSSNPGGTITVQINDLKNYSFFPLDVRGGSACCCTHSCVLFVSEKMQGSVSTPTLLIILYEIALTEYRNPFPKYSSTVSIIYVSYRIMNPSKNFS